MLKLNFFKQLLWQTTAIVNDDRAFAHNLAALKKTKQNNENIDVAYQKRYSVSGNKSRMGTTFGLTVVAKMDSVYNH